jgi:uncharacterized protein YodC (DUF2158 family)
MDMLEQEGEMGFARVARMLWMAGPTLAVSSVAAEELTSFVQAQAGTYKCWSRQYSESHLAEHPDQLVTAMDFTLQFDQDFQFFELNATLRGGQTGQSTGTCSEYEGVISCGVDCDGGSVDLTHGADGKVMLDLTRSGYIRMTDSCGEDEADGFSLEAGIDDKQFLLGPVRGKACKPLSWTN